MEVFFAKMGVKNLRFKPAYNPYTEVRFTLDSILSNSADYLAPP